jgi:hypothetical protein
VVEVDIHVEIALSIDGDMAFHFPEPGIGQPIANSDLQGFSVKVRGERLVPPCGQEYPEAATVFQSVGGCPQVKLASRDQLSGGFRGSVAIHGSKYFGDVQVGRLWNSVGHFLVDIGRIDDPFEDYELSPVVVFTGRLGL